jgi:hypothetical protein
VQPWAPWLAANVLVSSLLSPMLLQPFHLPPVAAYVFVLTLSWASLFIWPLVTIVLIGTRGLAIIHGHALTDLGFAVLPGIIELQLVRLFILGRGGRLTVIGLHAAIAIWWWMVWYAVLTGNFELQAGG